MTNQKLLGLALVLVCLCLFGLSAQHALAYLTDTGTHTEPALPAIGGAGSKITDPTFGSTILRVTDANDGSDCHDQYSYWPTFNKDNTHILYFCTINNVLTAFIADFNASTFTVSNKRRPSVTFTSDAIWSATDPNIIYDHIYGGTQLRATNISTGATTLVHDFINDAVSGGSLTQMSHSIDDNVFAATLTDSSGAARGYIVWRAADNKVLLKQLVSGLDEAEVDKTGSWLVAVMTSGDDYVWNLSNTPPTSTFLPWGTGFGVFHRDLGHGNIFDENSSARYLQFRQLSSPTSYTNLLLPARFTGIHFSMLADDEGWALVSSYNDPAGPVLNPYEQEIYEVATDGSGRVRRIAHHRSVYNDYYDSPLANISRDGNFVAFTSNWGNADGRRDLYIVQVGLTQPLPTATISAQPTVISAPNSSTLSWVTSGATSVSISPSVGSVGLSGSVAVHPTSTTAYTLTATNSYGSSTATVTVTVTFSDTTPPSVSISSPATGANLSGTVPVSASASDNVGITGVQFKLDGVNLGSEETSSPYAMSWDTTKVTNGSHNVTAVAFDLAGNAATSAAVQVNIQNAVTTADTTPPLISNIVISPGGTSATVSWSTNEPSTSQVLYGISTGLGLSSALNPSFVTSHSVSISGLAKRTVYYLQVASKDSSGNSAISGTQSFSTKGSPAKPSKFTASSGSINLAWTAGSIDTTSFDLYRSTSGFLATPDQSLFQANFQASDMGYHDVNVSVGQIYYYTLFAKDAVGALSDPATVQFTAREKFAQLVFPANVKEGEVLKFPNNPAIYLVTLDGLVPFATFGKYQNYVNASGQKLKLISKSSSLFSIQPFAAEKLLDEMGKVLGTIVLQTGTDFKYASSPTVYRLAADGTKQAFTSFAAFLTHGGNLAKIIVVSDDQMYPDGGVIN